jgi:phospholipase/lecithinase/hemolysin
MLLSKRPIRSLMAAAIALAALPAMAGESPYSKAVFFGDSLTDAGYFRPLLPAVRPVTGQFTTNPGWVWSQQVANYYGLNGRQRQRPERRQLRCRRRPRRRGRASALGHPVAEVAGGPLPGRQWRQG